MLISFNNEESLKESAIESVKTALDHNALEHSFGIPRWVLEIKPLFFNGIKNDCEEAKFYSDLLSSIPVGIDLDRVKWRFLSYMAERCISMIKKQSIRDESAKEMKEIIAYLEKIKNFFDHVSVCQCEYYSEYSFYLISKTFKMFIPQLISDVERNDIYEDHYKKLINFFKSEGGGLFFKFNTIKKEKGVSIDCNERSELIEHKKVGKFKYLKSLIRGIYK